MGTLWASRFLTPSGIVLPTVTGYPWLSETVSKVIGEIFEGQEEAAQVIKTIDDGFGAFNSRRRHADKPLRCGLGVNWDKQTATLCRLQELLLAARFGNTRSLFPLQQEFRDIYK